MLPPIVDEAMPSASPNRPTALVTGANRGLGLETCIQLKADGFRVILTSRNENEGTAAARKLDPEGKDVLYHQLDITDSGSIATLAKDLPRLASQLDVLVNNAGIGSWGADRRASIRTIETNYYGSRDVTDALLPFIPDGGRVVMVSSGLGELSTLGRDLRPQFADPSLTRPALDSLVSSYLASLEAGETKRSGWPSAYSVSKVALNSLTRILARELSPRGIRVNAVCPGWVRTDMGGRGATRSVPVGGRSIVLGVMLPKDATGGFYRDGKQIACEPGVAFKPLDRVGSRHGDGGVPGKRRRLFGRPQERGHESTEGHALRRPDLAARHACPGPGLRPPHRSGRDDDGDIHVHRPEPDHRGLSHPPLLLRVRAHLRRGVHRDPVPHP